MHFTVYSRTKRYRTCKNVDRKRSQQRVVKLKRLMADSYYSEQYLRNAYVEQRPNCTPKTFILHRYVFSLYNVGVSFDSPIVRRNIKRRDFFSNLNADRFARTAYKCKIFRARKAHDVLRKLPNIVCLV